MIFMIGMIKILSGNNDTVAMRHKAESLTAISAGRHPVSANRTRPLRPDGVTRLQTSFLPHQPFNKTTSVARDDARTYKPHYRIKNEINDVMRLKDRKDNYLLLRLFCRVKLGVNEVKPCPVRTCSVAEDNMLVAAQTTPDAMPCRQVRNVGGNKLIINNKNIRL